MFYRFGVEKSRVEYTEILYRFGVEKIKVEFTDVL